MQTTTNLYDNTQELTQTATDSYDNTHVATDAYDYTQELVQTAMTLMTMMTAKNSPRKLELCAYSTGFQLPFTAEIES